MRSDPILKISAHAEARMAKRGVKRDFLSALVMHADIETPVGGGATALRVSRKRSYHLNLDDLLHLYAVVCSTDSAVATVLPMATGSRGRRYRRS